MVGMAFDPMIGFDLEGAVTMARRDAGLKHQNLAALMGISSQQLSQQLAQRGHLSLYRLLLAARHEDGRAFWRAFLPLLTEHLGIEHADSIAAQLARLVDAVEGRKAMARAQGSSQSQQKVGA